MQKYNLLLLSSSNHVELVNSFKEAYNRLDLTGSILTGDTKQYCASAMVSNKHFTLPKSESIDYFPYLEKLIKENGINIVLTARDEELEILSKRKNFFEELGCFLLVSDSKSIELCRNKLKLNNFFLENNIPHPKTYIFEDLMDNKAIQYPLICKPKMGKGGVGIYIVNQFKSIKHLISDLSTYFFQEFIDGDWEYTIDVLNDLDRNVLSIIPRKRLLIKGGESYTSITEKNETLINYAKLISEKIGFIGHINIQCIMKDKVPYFIEINPRFGGASNLAFKAGMDSPYKIMQMITGEKVHPFIGDFENDFMMLRYTQDFFIKIQDD